MKNRSSIILAVGIAALFAQSAQAGDGRNDGTVRPGQVWSAASQGQEQFMNQQQGQTQAQTAAAKAAVESAINNAVQSTSGASSASTGPVTVQAPKIPDPVVSSAVAPALSVSSLTCLGSGALAISTPLVGISGGKSTPDLECERRQNILILQTLQRPGAAIRLACTQPDMRKALGAECD